MLPLRIASRRSCRIPQIIQRARIKHRTQHDRHGPHKEYFQQPSQIPQDVSPQPAFVTQQTAPAQSNIPLYQPGYSGNIKDGRGTLVRISRRISFMLFTFLAGIASGTALITWDYNQPPVERSSEEYDDLMEEIEEIILFDFVKLPPLYMPEGIKSGRDLEADSWLVGDVLRGPSGFTSKKWQGEPPRDSAWLTFVGDGLEISPDTIHPGAFYIMAQEGVDQCVTPLIKQEGLELISQVTNFTHHMSTFGALRPNETYVMFCKTTKLGMFGTGSVPPMVTDDTNFGLEIDVNVWFKMASEKEANGPSTQQTTVDDEMQNCVASGTFRFRFSCTQLERQEGQSVDDYVASSKIYWERLSKSFGER